LLLSQALISLQLSSFQRRHSFSTTDFSLRSSRTAWWLRALTWEPISYIPVLPHRLLWRLFSLTYEPSCKDFLESGQSHSSRNYYFFFCDYTTQSPCFWVSFITHSLVDRLMIMPIGIFQFTCITNSWNRELNPRNCDYLEPGISLYSYPYLN
jgi:hypothetical protein